MLANHFLKRHKEPFCKVSHSDLMLQHFSYFIHSRKILFKKSIPQAIIIVSHIQSFTLVCFIKTGSNKHNLCDIAASGSHTITKVMVCELNLREMRVNVISHFAISVNRDLLEWQLSQFLLILREKTVIFLHNFQ